ncbi:hypothetical protein D7W79_27720 [Corallococcus exercitus]|uniref:Uncharacterized protein n=1 Tax=Corallococcus exercitus TaxID=2316736 RepID=A0A3A8HMR9_9BACT|nr:hypothetical protein [Corallococcus exercitus]NOK35491.1 hypothetical protein [Corallococcus exercitus]RKG72672.1 hypothetical protein D7W79_27720 [Corallococcus exercitus]
MSVSKNIADLIAEAQKLLGTYAALKQDYEQLLDKETQEARTQAQILLKIRNAVSSTLGIFQGHLFEVRESLKHMKKGRVVILQTHADLTIGKQTDLFAKSIQLKSCTTDKPTDVDTLIAKAAYQLSGAKGEVPREQDRRIVDIQVAHPNNPWPYTPSKGRSSHALATLLEDAEERILKYFMEGKPKKERGFHEGESVFSDLGEFRTMQSVKLTLGSPFIDSGPKSTRMRLHSSVSSNTRFVVRTADIKIRFARPLKVTFGENKDDLLELAVFSLYRVGESYYCKSFAFALKTHGKKFFEVDISELD